MGKRMKKKIAEKLYFALIALMAVLCVVFYRMGSDNAEVNFNYDEDELRMLTSNWYLLDADKGESQKVFVPGEFDIEAGKTMRI